MTPTIEQLTNRAESQTFDQIYRESFEAGNPEPKYEQVAFMIVGTVYSLFRDVTEKDLDNVESSVKTIGNEDVLDKNDGVNDGVKSKIGASEHIALNSILEKPEITAKDLSIILNVKLRQAERILASLKKKDFITRIGSDKGGYWMVKT